MARRIRKVDREIASVVTVERYHVPGTESHAARALQAWPPSSLGTRVLPLPSTEPAAAPTLHRDLQGCVFAWEGLGK